MFIEESYQANDKSMIQYSLKDHDHPDGYRSLYKLYIECEDPTEYDFANKYLYNFTHWQDLCECTWFQPYLERWREHLELKIKEKALRHVQNIAGDTAHRNQFEAIKLLLNSGWKDKGKAASTRGRPSKLEVQSKLKEIAQEEYSLQEEFKRVSGETQ